MQKHLETRNRKHFSMLIAIGVFLTLIGMFASYRAVYNNQITINLSDEIAQLQNDIELIQNSVRRSLLVLFTGIITILISSFLYIKNNDYTITFKVFVVFLIIFLGIFEFFQYFWFMGTMECIIARSDTGIIIDWHVIKDCSY